MRRRSTARAVRVAAVVAAAAVLSACGSDEDRDAAPMPTTTVTATATATVTETATPEPVTRDCGQVGFEPQTDAGAFDIRASGVDCDTAREVAAAAEDARGERFTAAGFDCRPTGTTGKMPSTVVECSGPDDATITFDVS